jgi:hypothetical protein
MIFLKDGLCILKIFLWQPEVILGSISDETNQVLCPFVVGTVGENLFHLELFISIYQVWDRWDVGWPNLGWS